ncbi:MAG: phage major capsid protein, partial [Candidatus Moranbacteria bacterium]|nr:phage major capsid protein [Candidatus Moranbacteria bacterium]
MKKRTVILSKRTIDIETSDEAKQLRAGIFDKMSSMVNQAKAEKRQMTATEKVEYEELKADYDSLSGAVALLEKSEAEALRIAGRKALQKSKGGSEWRNISTGRVVPVLNKETRAVDVFTDGPSDLSLGRGIASFIRGDWSHAEEEKRALMSTGMAGGLLVPLFQFPTFVDLLRDSSIAISGGAMVAEMDTGKMVLAKVESDPEMSIKPENEKFEEGIIGISPISLNAKTIGCFIDVPLELTADAPNISPIIEKGMAAGIAKFIDQMILVGGGPSYPSGLAHKSGVNRVDV